MGMDTNEEKTMSFVLNTAIEAYLRERGDIEDRSLSAVLRRIIFEVMAADPAYTLPADKETEGAP